MKLKHYSHVFHKFFTHESASALLLLGATIIALLLANSPLQPFYTTSLHYSFGHLSLYHSVNDGLMTLFFLLVSLEIKRELLEGELHHPKTALLPVLAAIGGMLMPAFIYLLINFQNHSTLAGWAIPCATDIAFSLAILNLLGSRIPLSLRTFLTALAIIDDLGAILIIALFYTESIQLIYLVISFLCLLILIIVNLSGVKKLFPYLLVGGILWLGIFKSGVHATLAGVILAFTIPLTSTTSYSPLKNLETKLHPWVAYAILPLFALCNAGLSFSHVTFGHVGHPLVLGILLGLFIGKPLGIFTTVWLAIKLNFARLPKFANYKQLLSVSMLCGIGFTMSLFIGTLAFAEKNSLQELVKLGVFGGSILAALGGCLIVLKRE
jgi:NhaA family Na+:H+ antiporter